jgi:transglutaminase-like putative cysteine protease
MARTAVACLLPAVAIVISWLSLEAPAASREALAVAALAVAPALLPWMWARALAATGAAACAVWIAFGAEPWELLPFRDQRVLAPVADAMDQGIGDFYRVLLPFDPTRSTEMHALVLLAIFSFVLATALVVAAKRPLAAAAVAVAGAGWPATLSSGQTVELGTLALAAALSIPLLLRVRSVRSLVTGLAAASLVVASATWASSATTVARDAALDWESWDLSGLASSTATNVTFAWDADYEGVDFPPARTVVFTVEGPERAHYWRASTLDAFLGDHWIEDLDWFGAVDGDREELPRDQLTPRPALNEESWLEQQIDIKALADERLVAAGTPVAVDTRRLGAVFRQSGGVLRRLDRLREGLRYRVWSYAPDPAPRALAASQPRYPADARRYLLLESRTAPAFGLPGRHAAMRRLLSDPSYESFRPYTSLYDTARRVSRDADTPYETVLALENWFRLRGGFRYDESPPAVDGAPLIAFVNRTKAGYCQHYAGAMTLMLRMLGIPSRIAVGFTSGNLENGSWVVTDHEAHAWVEVWFAGHGWVPFDPTPGRATFGGNYSFASNDEAVIAALDRGDLSGFDNPRERGPDNADVLRDKPAAGDKPPSLFGLVLGGAALWVALVGLGKTLVRRLRYLTRDPREVATASRRELESYVRDQGIAVPACATLDDLRSILGEQLGIDCRMYADAAARARFGPPEDCGRASDAARQELRALLRRVRVELSVWARFRGLVSLRSLRKGWST